MYGALLDWALLGGLCTQFVRGNASLNLACCQLNPQICTFAGTSSRLFRKSWDAFGTSSSRGSYSRLMIPTALASGMVLTAMTDTALKMYTVHRVFLATLHTPRIFKEKAIPVGLSQSCFPSHKVLWGLISNFSSRDCPNIFCLALLLSKKHWYYDPQPPIVEFHIVRRHSYSCKRGGIRLV